MSRLETVFYDRWGKVVVPQQDSIVKPRQGVFALALACDAALLVWPAYAKDVGMLPGGGIEKSETPDQALRREWQEETGLDFKLVGPLKEYRHVRGFYVDEDDEFWIYDQTFRLYGFDGPVEIGSRWRNSEGDLVGWLPISALPKGLVVHAHGLGIMALLPEVGELNMMGRQNVQS